MKTIIEVQGQAKSGKTRMLVQATEKFLLSGDTPPRTVLELREVMVPGLKKPKITQWEE